MSIIIRRKEDGEVFDTPNEFAIEIQNTSPIFNDLGSKSSPATLPYTNNNKRLFEQSQRIDKSNKTANKTKVIISRGSYTRQSQMRLNSSINTQNNFNVTLAFNEGIMYEAMDDLHLTELSNLPLIDNMNMDQIFDYMNRLLVEDDLSQELTVFMVELKTEEYTFKFEGKEYPSHYNPILNSWDINEKKLYNRTQYKFVLEDELRDIDVPRGYGITPFIKVWKVLELIFDHFGYKIKTNPFKEQFQLNRLCILNNCTDTIINETINYKHLLPKVTIKDFLNSLYCRFGLKVFFNGTTNEVELLLLRDILNSRNYYRVLPNSKLDIEFTSAKQIKLSCNRGLDLSETETDTYEEFLKSKNNIVGYRDETQGYGLWYDRNMGIFTQTSVDNEGLPIDIKTLSSIHFDWNKKSPGLETEEISSIDEAITMQNGGYVPYLALEPSRLNSTYLVDGVAVEKDPDTKLVFAYDLGEGYDLEKNGEKKYRGAKMGSIFPYVLGMEQSGFAYREDKNGNQFKYALTLVGEDGAFNRFWKEYDAFLRHSNFTVKFDYLSPLFPLSKMMLYQKIIIDGQPMLIDKMNYTLDGKDSNRTSVEARTLRLYEPYDLSKDQELPVPLPILYKWVLFDNRQSDIDNLIDKESEEYKKSDTNSKKFKSMEMYKMLEDPQPPTALQFWFLSPTEEQYKSQTTIGNTFHTAKYRFKVVFTVYNIDELKWTESISYKDHSIEYKAWYIAEEI